jgi:poly-beta-1,6-N-acetyl-D-glucosamine synthase
MQPSILIISPMRNEVAHLERVARAVAAQELAPAAWIVVDDDSDDGSSELLDRLEAEIDVLRVVRPTDPSTLAGVPDRLARAAAPRAFNVGLAAADLPGWTHVMKLDGDVELPPDYLRRLMDRFDADPQLGIACGDLVEPRPGGMERIPIPPHHVHGALKCYTRACFEAIGGVQVRLGWDTIDETYARLRGFRTRSFSDIVAVHHRHLGSADGTLRGRARHGECAYIAHFGPLWVGLRAFKIARSRPYGISGVAFYYGYVRAAARGTERVPDPEFRRFAKAELRRRMVRALPLGRA